MSGQSAIIGCDIIRITVGESLNYNTSELRFTPLCKLNEDYLCTYKSLFCVNLLYSYNFKWTLM